MPLEFDSHADYLAKWQYWFRREVVSFLLNARHTDKYEQFKPQQQ